jgi:hypothetical protein
VKAEITPTDVAALAQAVGLTLKEGNAPAIADMLTSIHATVLGEANKTGPGHSHLPELRRAQGSVIV